MRTAIVAHTKAFHIVLAGKYDETWRLGYRVLRSETSSRANRTPPTGAEKATAIPVPAAHETTSRTLALHRIRDYD